MDGSLIRGGGINIPKSRGRWQHRNRSPRTHFIEQLQHADTGPLRYFVSWHLGAGRPDSKSHAVETEQVPMSTMIHASCGLNTDSNDEHDDLRCDRELRTVGLWFLQVVRL